MRGFEYDWRKVDVFDVTDSVVSFESHDTIVEVVKGAGTVMFLTGIAGLIATIIGTRALDFILDSNIIAY